MNSLSMYTCDHFMMSRFHYRMILQWWATNRIRLLLIEVMLLVLLGDSLLVRLLKIFGQNNISVLPDCMHPGLQGGTE